MADFLVHEGAWERARDVPDEVAFYLEDAPPVTFGAVAREARALANGMAQLGLRAGDTVSFLLPNWLEAVPINIAASALGLAVNPIVPIYRDAECLHILKDSGARLLFVPESWRGFAYADMIHGLRDRLPSLEHVIVVHGNAADASSYEALLRKGEDRDVPLPDVDPDAVKLVLYTSGTTGPAKAVLHSHRSLAASRGAGAEYWRPSADDVVFMPSPVTHITGYSLAVEWPFFAPVKAALMLRWEAGAAIDYIERVGATLTVGATPFLQELVAEARRRGTGVPSLRMFACGGAAVPPDLIRLANTVLTNCRCHRMYGSTEAPAVTRGWMDAGEEELAATTDGRIIDWDVAVRDSAGGPCPVGSDGEILVRGAGLFLGYRDAAQTEASFSADGYFLTGDIGHVTEEGAICITGRSKDIIIRGGENLSAKEIEDVLHRHPAIAEAAAVSMPHARLGESVCAFLIIAEAAATPRFDELVQFVAGAGLARQKIPERIEIVQSFPRTPSGKIRKDQLRAMIREQLARERTTPVATDST
jgi:acyl-CoA synthetase (AMP-forming)/AMP-acid ligase II